MASSSPSNDSSAQIRVQLDSARTLIDTFAPLLLACSQRDPNFVEVVALGGMLHSIYYGMERVFVLIAQEYDGGVPAGDEWHLSLLRRMNEATDRRKAVISQALFNDARVYLQFRHVFRHNWAHRLEWAKMEPLVAGSAKLVDRYIGEVEAFVASPS